MKFLLFAATMAGSAMADPFATDAPPDHTVYNCEKVRQDVDEANDMIGDGNCDAEVNCGPFSYDLGDCWDSADDVCMGDSWYTTGRENFRCSTRTGGIRLGRAGNNDDTGVATHDEWTNPCDCYQECTAIAAREGMPLVAFDMYSGKCRCWSGTCDNTDTGSKPCRNGGDDYGVGSPKDGGLGDGPELGNNWRCPSEIYFPNLQYDCDGNDITFRYPNLEMYIGDGFCDDGSTANQQYAGMTGEDVFNLNCEAFNYDGGDCNLDCHESVYWATDFVNLNTAKYKIDECTAGQPLAQTAWTSACDCYSYCAGVVGDLQTDFLFDHDQADLCRCWDSIDGEPATLATLAPDDNYESFCGLNSNCQVYEPNRHSDCEGNDYTLGVYGEEGECFEEVGDVDSATAVISWDEYLDGHCRPQAMCMDSSWSNGQCFDCERFSTERNIDSYCDGATPSMSITTDDLDTLISEGYLQGSATDVSTDGDNCACLNYCFSASVESTLGTADAEDWYDIFNTIAAHDFAYGVRDGSCVCYDDCPVVAACGSAPDDCLTESTVFYSTVADLNVLE